MQADAETLRIALDALIENAVKYTEDGDAIELRSRSSGSTIVIEVQDDGCRIPEHALTLIFERFARADAARTRSHGGVGHGLAIVDAIAKAHGGRCTVSSQGRGATFALQLPQFLPAEAERPYASLPSLSASS